MTTSSRARYVSILANTLNSSGKITSNNLLLPDSGVTAGTYGSASQVPVLTVDSKGRITSASVTSVAGVSSFSYNTSTARLTINTADGGTFNADITLAPFSTTNLTEGTNQYFTTARARASISSTGTNLSYNSTTGVLSYTQGNTDTVAEGATNLYYTNARARGALSYTTGSAMYNSTSGQITIPSTTSHITEDGNLYYTDARVRAALAAGTGVSYNSSTGTFSIGQPVATTDNVTFANVTATGNLTITGNLTVSGTTTTVNSTTVSVADINIEVARNATTAAQANGAGLTVTGPTTPATLTYSSADDRWNLNKDLNINRVFGNLTGAVTGNASTASTLQNSRSFTITGDAAWTINFDGSANVSGALTLANSGVTAGSYGSGTAIPVLTIDSKGRVTSASTSAVVIGDGTMTVTAGAGLTGGGQVGTANQTGASSVTISHADTSSVVNQSAATNTFISGITFDTYGHVQTIATGSPSGFLTAESDTLATVTARGASTSTLSTFSGGIYSTKIGISSSNLNDTINGAPWYGIGHTDLDFGAGMVPQFAGYYGLRIRTASTVMDFGPSGDPGNINVSSGGFKIGGNIALHAGNVSTYALPITGGTLTGASTVSVSTWEKWTLETTGVTARARQGSDGNGLNFTSNARWTGSAWAEDDSTRKKFAYIQHLGNGRHEFRTAATGAGISWTPSLTIDESQVNSLVPLQLNANQLRFDNTGVRSWSVGVSAGNLAFNSGDGAGRFVFGGDIDIASRFRFATANAFNNSQYAIIGLDPAGATAGTFKHFGIYDYTNARSMFEVYGDTRNIKVFGNIDVGSGNRSPAGTAFSNTIAAIGTSRTVNFDGNGTSPSVWWTNGATAIGAIDAIGGGGLSFWANNGSAWQQQINMSYGTVNVLTTLQNNGNQVLHAGNFTSYSPSLTGSGASGTWGISISGNSATATSAWQLNTDTGSKANALQYWQMSGNSTLNPNGNWHYALRMSHGDADTYYSATLALDFHDDVFQFRRKVNGTNQSWRTLLHSGNFSSYAVANNGSSWTPHPSTSRSSAWNTFYTDSGYIQLGPANSSWAHIYSDKNFYFNNGIWIADNRVLDAGNFTNYSPGLTGSGASGTWGISITGSAAQLGGVNANNYFRVDGNYPNADMNSPVQGYWHVASNASGLPESQWGHRWDFDHVKNGQWVFQMYSPTGSDAGLWFRQRRDYTWQTWRKVVDSTNIGSYAIPLGGSWYGSGLPGSRVYGVSVNGGEFVLGNGLPNAGQVGVLVDGCYVAGENNGFWSMGSDNSWGSRRGFYWDGSNINFTVNGPQVAVTRLTVGGGGGSSWINMEDSDEGVRYLHNNSSTIGFVANDGSWSFRVSDDGNIWLRNRGWFSDIVARRDIYNSVNNGLQVYRNIGTIGGSWPDGEHTLGLENGDAGHIVINWHRAGYTSHNMRYNGSDIYFDLAISSAGNVTAFSDERLKKDWLDLPSDFIDRLATIKHGTYTRIDSGERQAGASAQDWKKLLPEVVTETGNDNTLALAYGNAAVVSAIELAKKVVEQEDRIAKLEALVETLINKLGEK